VDTEPGSAAVTELIVKGIPGLMRTVFAGPEWLRVDVRLPEMTPSDVALANFAAGPTRLGGEGSGRWGCGAERSARWRGFDERGNAAMLQILPSRSASPSLFFEIRINTAETAGWNWDISQHGRRFLFNIQTDQVNIPSLIVLTNWQSRLKDSRRRSVACPPRTMPQSSRLRGDAS